MPATLNREFEKRFGIPLLDGYGITETSTMVTMNWPTGGARARLLRISGAGACGAHRRSGERARRRGGPGGRADRARPQRDARLSQQAGGDRRALRDGWYYTGDLARSDENGFLTITGRLKELIIRGGQNIAPAEIEEVVNTFETVLDCAVVGIPHEHLGEVAALFVVARPGRRSRPRRCSRIAARSSRPTRSPTSSIPCRRFRAPDRVRSSATSCESD